MGLGVGVGAGVGAGLGEEEGAGDGGALGTGVGVGSGSWGRIWRTGDSVAEFFELQPLIALPRASAPMTNTAVARALPTTLYDRAARSEPFRIPTLSTFAFRLTEFPGVTRA